jgi:hypothetical protein
VETKAKPTPAKIRIKTEAISPQDLWFLLNQYIMPKIMSTEPADIRNNRNMMLNACMSADALSMLSLAFLIKPSESLNPKILKIQWVSEPNISGKMARIWS